MKELKIGSKAPDFSLKDKDDNTTSLNEIDSDFVVVYFYPKDMTKGCTLEAKGFNDDLQKYEKLNIKIIGVSSGNNESKKKFCEKNNLELTLLSDTNFSVSKEYGVYGKKKFMGREYLGISRTTFILDKYLKIIRIFNKVKPIGHSKQVLEFIKIFIEKEKK
jgi:peroxiredoxin Q/BCP